MFGHQDEPQNQANSPFTPAVPEPAADSALDAGIADIVTSSAPPAPMPLPDVPADAMPQTPTADSAMATPSEEVVTPSAPTANPMPDSPIDTNALLDIKQQALQQLSPLVGHLDQNPEEKFRTTMMMIQAADNQDLIGAAYAAAQSITDEKARAQALLDIVNEINYFTQRQAK